MSLGEIEVLLRNSIFNLLMVAAPVLLISLAVGLIVSIFQATTSIQEQTLTFVPKIIAILVSIALLGGWMLSRLGEFTRRIFELIGRLSG